MNVIPKDIAKVRKQYIDHLFVAAAECGLPEGSRLAIINYIVCGTKVGDFLAAVITNDLKAAWNYADYQNRQKIGQWVQFMYDQVPAACWGDTESLVAWRAKQGLYEGEEPEIKQFPVPYEKTLDAFRASRVEATLCADRGYTSEDGYLYKGTNPQFEDELVVETWYRCNSDPDVVFYHVTLPGPLQGSITTPDLVEAETFLFNHTQK